MEQKMTFDEFLETMDNWRKTYPKYQHPHDMVYVAKSCWERLKHLHDLERIMREAPDHCRRFPVLADLIALSEVKAPKTLPGDLNLDDFRSRGYQSQEEEAAWASKHLREVQELLKGSPLEIGG